jgi:hypothetical protein
MRDGNLGRVGGVGDPAELERIMRSPGDNLDGLMERALPLHPLYPHVAEPAGEPYHTPEYAAPRHSVRLRKPQLSTLIYAEKVGVLILMAVVVIYLLHRATTAGPRAAGREAIAGLGGVK